MGAGNCVTSCGLGIFVDQAAKAQTIAGDQQQHGVHAVVHLGGGPGRAGGTRAAESIRQHAERTDPLNGPLRLEEVTSCSHEELQRHMRGWSTHGPYRN